MAMRRRRRYRLYAPGQRAEAGAAASRHRPAGGSAHRGRGRQHAEERAPSRRPLPGSPVILEDETDSVLVALGLAVVILPAEVGLDPPSLAQFQLHAGLVLLAAPDALARVVEHLRLRIRDHGPVPDGELALEAQPA